MPLLPPVQGVLKRLMTAYHGQLKLVFRDFPLRQIHPEAQKAAEAAQCANDQGQFWPYHDRLFAVTELGVEALRQYAVELGLDAEQFNACLDSDKYRDEVQKDIDDALAAGVNATPSFSSTACRSTAPCPLSASWRWSSWRWSGPTMNK